MRIPKFRVEYFNRHFLLNEIGSKIGNVYYYRQCRATIVHSLVCGDEPHQASTFKILVEWKDLEDSV